MLKLIANTPQTGFADLQGRLIAYASRVEQLPSPDRVLDELHLITRSVSLSVLGAARFPAKVADWDSIQIGKSAFLHEDVPKGWWEEYHTRAQGKFRPALFLASSSIAAFTWTEVLRMLLLSLAMILMMLLRPAGMIPARARYCHTEHMRPETSA